MMKAPPVQQLCQDLMVNLIFDIIKTLSCSDVSLLIAIMLQEMIKYKTFSNLSLYRNCMYQRQRSIIFDGSWRPSGTKLCQFSVIPEPKWIPWSKFSSIKNQSSVALQLTPPPDSCWMCWLLSKTGGNILWQRREWIPPSPLGLWSLSSHHPAFIPVKF